MKAVLVIYNEAIDLEVTEALPRAGIEFYTKFTGVLGKGSGSGARLGNSIWPGGNRAILAAVGDQEAERLIEQVRKLQRDIPAEGLRVMWWTVEGMV